MELEVGQTVRVEFAFEGHYKNKEAKKIIKGVIEAIHKHFILIKIGEYRECVNKCDIYRGKALVSIKQGKEWTKFDGSTLYGRKKKNDIDSNYGFCTVV